MSTNRVSRIAFTCFSYLLLVASFFTIADRLNNTIAVQSAARPYTDAALRLQQQEPESAIALITSDTLSPERKSLLAWATGMTLVHLNRPQKAAALWRVLDEETSSQLDAMLLQMSREHEMKSDLLTAEHLLRGWVSRFRTDWNRHHFLGNFYLRHDKERKAISTFEQGAIVTTGAGSAYLAGRAADVSGEWNVARSYYEKALELEDPPIITYFHLAVLLNRRFRDPVTAVATCERAVHRAPENYACYEQLGLLHIQLNERGSAARWFAAGFDNVDRPSYQRLFINHLEEIAVFHEQNGELAQALDTYLMILERDTENSLAIEGIHRLDEGN